MKGLKKHEHFMQGYMNTQTVDMKAFMNTMNTYFTFIIILEKIIKNNIYINRKRATLHVAQNVDTPTIKSP